MIIALASPRVVSSVAEGLGRMRQALEVAAERGAAIVCFPEAWMPGLRGLECDVPEWTVRDQEHVLHTAREWTRSLGIAAVLGMEWLEGGSRLIAAVVLDRSGELLGIQTKNQLDPTEEPRYTAGTGRQLFDIEGLRFGVAICHEGFRYPETVRWAARRGAHVVFHPHCTGSDRTAPRKTAFAAPDAPYYERAMLCRALENTVYFASVNYAFKSPDSATCVITPSGECQARLAYGESGVLVAEIDPAQATGLLASRFAPERYGEGNRQAG